MRAHCELLLFVDGLMLEIAVTLGDCGLWLNPSSTKQKLSDTAAVFVYLEIELNGTLMCK